jgi:hypothetical protein
MARFKNVNWGLPGADSDRTAPVDMVKQALLMDIRDELQTLREINRAMRDRLNCRETMAIPGLLKQIVKNTTKRKYVRKAK